MAMLNNQMVLSISADLQRQFSATACAQAISEKAGWLDVVSQ